MYLECFQSNLHMVKLWSQCQVACRDVFALQKGAMAFKVAIQLPQLLHIIVHDLPQDCLNHCYNLPDLSSALMMDMPH